MTKPWTIYPISSVLHHFQKGSLHLEDAKYLTALGLQVGLKYTDPEKSVGEFLPNATKCDTWNDVKASHLSRNHKVVVSLDDVKGWLKMWYLGC